MCRYPQFFATRMMSDSIRRAFKEQTSKGGTYFGATGCGKTYTMMFIARQLALRCKELGSPTVIMIVDRDDLQTQAGKLFLRSQDFLQLGTVKSHLRPRRTQNRTFASRQWRILHLYHSEIL